MGETNGYCDKAASQNGQRIKVFTIYVFQLDEDGNFQTTIVAIDATQFKSKPKGVQYEESALVRELNKALVGFYNPEVGSEIIRSPSGVYYFIKLQGDLLLDQKMSDLPRDTKFLPVLILTICAIFPAVRKKITVNICPAKIYSTVNIL